MVRRFAELLWKECRQTAALAEFLAMGAAVWMLAIWAVWAGSWPYRGLVHPAANPFLLFAAALIGATAFAGGGPAGGLVFLAEKPADRWARWLAKVAVRYGIWLGLAAEAVALSRLLKTGPPEYRRDVLSPLWLLGPPTLAFCFLASATLCRRALAFLPGGLIGLGVSLVVLTTYPFRVLGDAGSVAVLCAALLAAGGLVVSRRPPAAVKGWRPWALLGGTAGVLTATAIALHFLCFAVACGLLDPRSARLLYVYYASPDGRMLGILAKFELPVLKAPASLLMVLDAETGGLRLVTRWNSSYTTPYRRGTPWSPDGRYLMFTHKRDWARPLPDSFGLRPGVQHDSGRITLPTCADIFDTATGRSQTLPDTAYDLIRWLEADRALALRPERKFALGPGQTLAVYDSTSRALQPIVLSDGSREFEIVPYYRPQGLALRRANKHRVWGPLLFYDRSTHAWLERPFPKGAEPPSPRGGTGARPVRVPSDEGYGDPSVQGSVLAISGDDRCVVFARDAAETDAPQRHVLFDLVEGKARNLDTQSLRRRTGYAGEWLFSAANRWLLTLDTRECASPGGTIRLYDLRTGGYRDLEPPRDARGAPAFSNDGARLLWCSGSPQGIVIEDPGTGERRMLTLEAIGLGSGQPWSWWLAGDWLGLTLHAPTGPELFRVRWDGTGLERLFP
jgi:hypothetical protein